MKPQELHVTLGRKLRQGRVGKSEHGTGVWRVNPLLSNPAPARRAALPLSSTRAFK